MSSANELAEPARGHAMPARVVTSFVVKRSNPRLLSPYGHWWLEIARRESYGWWPDRPLRLRHWVTGTGGQLNGLWLNPRATATRDAMHRVPADHRFHPISITAKTDQQLREEVRAFAQSYRGGWCWHWPWSRRQTQNCRIFQDELFASVGLIDGPGQAPSRGAGCPALFPLRFAVWAVVDASQSAWRFIRARS